jgi:hypothetical protein
MARGRFGIERERTIRAIIFRRVKSRTLGFVMLRRRDAGGAHGPRAGPNPLAVPAMHGGGERGNDDLAPLGGEVRGVLLGHERLLRGSTATRQRATNPLEDGITNPAPLYCPIAPCLGLRSRRCQGQTGICLEVDSRLPRLVGTPSSARVHQRPASGDRPGSARQSRMPEHFARSIEKSRWRLDRHVP